MHQPYNSEYEKAQEEYFQKFDVDFPGYAYRAEDGIKIIKTCLKTGKPYDSTSDPDFDPDADY